MHRRTIFLFFFVFALLISSCKDTETESAAEVFDETEALVATDTAIPTATETSTNTPEPSSTSAPTTTLTPTPEPTQFSGFDFATVFKAYAYKEETIFYFIVPGVASSYYGAVDGYDLVCESSEDEENLLVCRTEENLFGSDWKSFTFFADEEKTFLIYEGDFSTTLDKLPPTATPVGFYWPRADFTTDDITWGETPKGCTVRGINLRCETEYRLYEDGVCRVGMSCYDDCGYYYSVNTIDEGVGSYIFSGPCY